MRPDLMHVNGVDILFFVSHSSRESYHHGDLAAALGASARELVRRHGAAGFSLRAAAKEAGVDPAAVYRHYKDKQALLERVCVDGFIELADEMESAYASKRRPHLRFAAVGEVYVRFAVREPELFRLMLGPQRTDVATVASAAVGGRSPYHILLGALEDLRDAERCALPIRRAAVTAWSAVHGLAYLAIESRVDDLEVALRDVTQTLLRGLEPR